MTSETFETPDTTTLARTDVLPAGILLDMDGTLVDSEPHWIAGEQKLAALHGTVWTHEDALANVGTPMPVFAAALQARGVPLSIDEIITWLLAYMVEAVSGNVIWRPGAQELLAKLSEAGIPCAIVTMAYRELAEIVVASAPEGIFQALVAGDDVTSGKPHPEPYLTGAARLGVDPAHCVAIEDTLNGTLSAEAAGVPALVVPNVKLVPAAPGRSRVSSLHEIGITELAQIRTGRTIDTIRDDWSPKAAHAVPGDDRNQHGSDADHRCGGIAS